MTSPYSIAADLLEASSGSRYWDDPVAWARDIVHWKATPYQEEILQAIPTEKRVAVRGPHGLGKTAIGAIAENWFSHTREAAQVDWKCITTASAWRQLEKYLWPEIHKWSRQMDWKAARRAPYSHVTELLQLALKLRYGSAFAVASDDATLLEGAHADHLFYIFDEAKAIPTDTWNAAEGAFSGSGKDTPSEAFALAISTPGEPVGRFAEIQMRRPGTEDWWVRHVTLDEAIAAGRVSREWADMRARQWGVTSSVYINRVLGEFAAADQNGVIPSLAWIEAAIERWQAANDREDPERPTLSAVGVDVARSGADKTKIAVRAGNHVDTLLSLEGQDTMATTGVVANILTNTPGVPAIVDVIGVGAGVVDRLRELGYNVIGFNAAMRSNATDRSGELAFANQRAEIWWAMREVLDPESGVNLELPPDDELTGDLLSPRWKMTSGGKILVESKDEIRRRLGRSTDAADAVLMTLFEPDEESEDEVLDLMDRPYVISPY